MEGGFWGLIVVASAFFIQVLAFGLSTSIGVYNVEFLREFDEDTVGVSLIAAVNWAVFLGSGPLASFLMTKTSYRKIALVGSVMVVTGVVLMPFLPYLPALVINFGVLAGVGSGLVYLPSHVLTGLYYKRYQSLATGVATSGSGLGGAVMPIVTGKLIQYYGWKGSLLLMAGLQLHLVVFAALLRSPPRRKARKEKEPPEENGVPVSEDKPLLVCKENDMYAEANSQLDNIENEGMHQTSLKHVRQTTGAEQATQEISIARTDDSEVDSVNSIRNFNQHQHCDDPLLEISCSTDLDAHGKANSAHSELNPILSKEPAGRRTDGTPSGLESASVGKEPADVTHSGLDGEKATTEKGADGTPSGLAAETQANVTTSGLESTDCPADSTERRVLKKLRHIYLFTDVGFSVYFLSSVLWNASTSAALAFAPDFMTHRGLSSLDAAWLLALLGLGNFLGSNIGAVMGNLWPNHRLMQYTAANILFGVCLGAFPLGSSLAGWVGLHLCAGLMLGVILGLLVVVLINLIGVVNIKDGMGYVMLANGIGAFAGPSLTGYIYKLYGSYNMGFYVAGVFAILAGVSMWLIPAIHYCFAATARPSKISIIIT